MAETLKPDDRGVGDNSIKAMSDEELMRHVDEQITPIEQEMKRMRKAISEAKKPLVARGISMRAFNFIREARNIPADKLAKESVSLSMAARAFGVEMQGILFQPHELPDQKAPTKKAASPKHRSRAKGNGAAASP